MAAAVTEDEKAQQRHRSAGGFGRRCYCGMIWARRGGAWSLAGWAGPQSAGAGPGQGQPVGASVLVPLGEVAPGRLGGALSI